MMNPEINDTEDTEEFDDIYTESQLAELLDDDSITSQEEAFMRGYRESCIE
jgi:hypothetical protein